MATTDKMNIFEMVEHKMMDEVLAKVRSDLVRDLTAQCKAQIEAELEDKIVEYSASAIRTMENYHTLSTEYQIWLKKNEGEPRQLAAP